MLLRTLNCCSNLHAIRRVPGIKLVYFLLVLKIVFEHPFVAYHPCWACIVEHFSSGKRLLSPRTKGAPRKDERPCGSTIMFF